MDKTFTFDNNIVSFRQYKIENSILTIIGEIHNPNIESTVSEYIRDINNTDETFVFLELDTTSVTDKTYMGGILSSVIKDVTTKVGGDNLIYFDNRNVLLGRQKHYELYHGEVKDIKYYIEKYDKYTKSPYLKIRHKELDAYVKSYKSKEDKLKSMSVTTSAGRGRNWAKKLNTRDIIREIGYLRGILINGFREFWANVIDENLLNTIRGIIENNPEKKFEIIVIVGERHAEHLGIMISNTMQIQPVREIPSLPGYKNKPITIKYRADSYWDDMDDLIQLNEFLK